MATAAPVGPCFADLVMEQVRRWQAGEFDHPRLSVDVISERPLVVVIVDSRSGVERRSPPLVIRRGRDRVSQFPRKAKPPRISVKDGVVNFQVSGTHNCR